MKKIAVLVSDLGGLNQALPVAQLLRKMEHVVTVYASGKSVQRLKELGEEFVELTVPLTDSCMDSMGRNSNVVVVTMNDKEDDPSLAVARYLEGRHPVVALQDAYGARLRTTWADTRPTVICVNDPVAVVITLRAWRDMQGLMPGFRGPRIWPTGKPSLDVMHGYDIAGAGTRLEEMYDFKRDGRKVVYFGGALDCTGRPVLEVVKVLNSLNQNVFLILRHHPRMAEDSPHQVPFWEEARATFTGGTLLQNPLKVDPLTVTAGADVVLSTFSGVLDDAATLHRPSIAVLYKDDAMKEYLRVTGGALDDLPLVQLGVTAKATSRKSLKSRLKRALEGTLKLKEYRVDGNNTKRVAEVVLLSA